MTTTRPYRNALPVDVAIAELRENSGSQFDPVVVDVLLARLEREYGQMSQLATAPPA
jgi:HD-GYP domain-containing protein (c-di-GMP phosphodiesterase class II)